MKTLRVLLILLAALVTTSACGLIFGDAEHWFPGPITRIGVSLVIGAALGYGAHRMRKHERREERRDRRDERHGSEPKA